MGKHLMKYSITGAVFCLVLLSILLSIPAGKAWAEVGSGSTENVTLTQVSDKTWYKTGSFNIIIKGIKGGADAQVAVNITNNSMSSSTATSNPYTSSAHTVSYSMTGDTDYIAFANLDSDNNVVRGTTQTGALGKYTWNQDGAVNNANASSYWYLPMRLQAKMPAGVHAVGADYYQNHATITEPKLTTSRWICGKRDGATQSSSTVSARTNTSNITSWYAVRDSLNNKQTTDTWRDLWTVAELGTVGMVTLDAGSAPYYRMSGASMVINTEYDQFTVTLDRQSGDGGSSSVTATYNTEMPAITPPTRTGYTFGGYYGSTNGGGTQYYDSSGASAHVWDQTSNKTIYAKWTANTYTISYNLNGGTAGANQPTSATYGTSFTVSAPTKSGQTFSGWAITGMDSTTHTYGTTTNSNTSFTTSASTFNNLRSTSGTVTFTAQWSSSTSVTLTIRYHNGNRAGTDLITGTAVAADALLPTSGWSGANSTQTIAPNNASFTNGYDPPNANGSSANAQCTWAMSYTGGYAPSTKYLVGSSSATRKFNASILYYSYAEMCEALGVSATQSATVDLYVEVLPIITIRYHANSGTIPDSPHFYSGTNRWYWFQLMDDGLVAKAEAAPESNIPESYVTDYPVRGSTPDAVHDLWNVGTFNLKLTGYHVETARMWNSQPDGSGTDIHANTATLQEINGGVAFTVPTIADIYANWIPNTYTVHYNANGGSGTAMADSAFTYDAEGNLTRNTYEPPLEGYSFGGWAASPEAAAAGTVLRANGVAHGNLTTGNGGQVTLYAIWKRGISFKSGLPANPATITVYQYYDSVSATGSSATSPTAANCVDLDGWTELGWRSDSEATLPNLNFNTSFEPVSSGYHAVYSRNVRFYSGQSKATTTTIAQYYNAEGIYNLTTPTADTCTDISGWTEAGWRADGNADAPSKGFGMAWNSPAAEFYAVYSRSRAITYDAGGGTGTAPEDTVQLQYYNTSPDISTPLFTLAPNTFVNEGYVFETWDLGYANSTYSGWSPAFGDTDTTKTATAQWGQSHSYDMTNTQVPTFRAAVLKDDGEAIPTPLPGATFTIFRIDDGLGANTTPTLPAPIASKAAFEAAFSFSFNSNKGIESLTFNSETLKAAGLTYITNQTTDASGYAYFDELDAGSAYAIVETTSPAIYALNDPRGEANGLQGGTIRNDAYLYVIDDYAPDGKYAHASLIEGMVGYAEGAQSDRDAYGTLLETNNQVVYNGKQYCKNAYKITLASSVSIGTDSQMRFSNIFTPEPDKHYGGVKVRKVSSENVNLGLGETEFAVFDEEQFAEALAGYRAEHGDDASDGEFIREVVMAETLDSGDDSNDDDEEAEPEPEIPNPYYVEPILISSNASGWASTEQSELPLGTSTSKSYRVIEISPPPGYSDPEYDLDANNGGMSGSVTVNVLSDTLTPAGAPFTNPPFRSGGQSLTATKVLDDGTDNPTLADGQFSFSLYGPDDPDMASSPLYTATNSVDGSVSFGQVTYDGTNWTYTDASGGTHAYADDNTEQAFHVFENIPDNAVYTDDYDTTWTFSQYCSAYGRAAAASTDMWKLGDVSYDPHIWTATLNKVDEETSYEFTFGNSDDATFTNRMDTPTGGCKVMKAASDTLEPLKNAEFTVYLLNDQDERVSAAMVMISGNDGVADSGEVLEVGRYEVVETEAPEGYVIDTEWKKTFEITADGQYFDFTLNQADWCLNKIALILPTGFSPFAAAAIGIILAISALLGLAFVRRKRIADIPLMLTE